MVKKFSYPVNLFWRYTNKIYQASESDRKLSDNGKALRNYIDSYVQKRKSGERKSTVADGVDLLSLFLSQPAVFTDEVIIDELVDFFAAGSETTQNGTQTIVNHFVKDKTSLEKVRKEFAEVKKAYIEEHPEL
jgi:cytochrome P450